MSLIEINWQPTKRQIRQFSVVCLVALPLVGWIWGAEGRWLLGLFGAGAGIALLGWTVPGVIRPVYLGLTVITAPIGMVIGELLMVMIYFGVVCPLGLLGRVVGRDRLRLKLDRAAKSCWEKKKRPSSVRSYYRQS